MPSTDEPDYIEGLPSRAHPPAWGRYDERAAQPDTSVEDKPDTPAVPNTHPVSGATLIPKYHREARHYRMEDKVGRYRPLCNFVPPVMPRKERWTLVYTTNPDRVTCQACYKGFLETRERENKIQAAYREKKRLERELEAILTPAERAKRALERRDQYGNVIGAAVAEAQVWALLAIAEKLGDAPEEVETVFRGWDGERIASKSWVHTPLEDLPQASTHYTVHTDGSVTDNMTGKTYAADEKLEDVLVDSTEERSKPMGVTTAPLGSGRGYTVPDGPVVIHYTRPRIDWNSDRHPSYSQMTIRKARQRYQ